MTKAFSKIYTTLPTKALCLSLLIFAFAVAPVGAQSRASARLQMTTLDRLAPHAVETVDIQIDERLLQLAAKYLSNKEPDEAQVRELVAGLKGIYVKSFEFGEENRYAEEDVEQIRAQLRAPGWSRIVEVRSKREEENIEVYVLTEAERIEGLAVISFEPRELTVINIVGPVDLDKLSRLQGQFGIPQLEIERTNNGRKQQGSKN